MTSFILHLPPELTFKILEFIIPEEFYCVDVSDEEETKQLETITRTTSLRDRPFDLFEELKNYLMIHRDLFYHNFINLHCNRHFLIIWKRILYVYEYSYKRDYISKTIDVEPLTTITNCKTGDELSVNKLIRDVFSRYNSPECILESFFNMKFPRSGGGALYLSFFNGGNDLLKELMCMECSENDWKEKFSKLEVLLSQFPSLTLNSKYSIIFIKKLKIIIIDKQIYSTIIKMKKRKHKNCPQKEEHYRAVLELIFQKVYLSESSISAIENIKELSIILSTMKVEGLDNLFDRMFSKWILDNPISNRSLNLKTILFDNAYSGDEERYKYCVIESFIVSGQFKELEECFKMIEIRLSSDLVSNAMSEIISIYFDKIELFDREATFPQLINILVACWNLKDNHQPDNFISILNSLVSVSCKKALQVQDDQSIVELFGKFYWELFSKKFLKNLRLELKVILESNILMYAIEHVGIFEFLMTQAGNQKTYHQQLTNLCKDSTIYVTMLRLSISVNGELHYYTIKIRNESPYHDTIQLFEKRLRAIKHHLNNFSLFSSSLTSNSKFNETLKLSKDNVYPRTIWMKTTTKIKGIIQNLLD